MIRAILSVLPRPALVLVALLAQTGLAAAQGAPDLSILSLTPSPTQVTVGSTVTVSGTALASGFNGNVTVALDLQVPPMGATLPLGTRQIFFSDGQSMFSTSFVVPALATPGTYQLRATVDPANVVAESDETNNVTIGTNTIGVVTADLRAASLTGAMTGIGGRPYAIELTIENNTPVAANGFVYTYYFGPNASGTPLFTSTPIDLAGNAQTVRMDTIALPAVAGPATITALVNGNLLVPEGNLTNNVRSFTLTIDVPLADLQATLAPINGTVELGQSLAVSGNIQNFGREGAQNVTWAIMLSADPLISGADRELGRYTLPNALLNGTFEAVMETVRIPTDITPGNYYLGLLADPAEAIAEEDESNNGSDGTLLQVFQPELLIATQTLPTGLVGQAYAAALVSVGGAFPPDWSIADGQLPAGLLLDPMQGILQGRPTVAGVYTFTVQARSGAATAEAELELTILEGEGPPVVDTTLPAGRVGVPYTQSLFARGGLPPYTWATMDPLPAGLTLTAEGLLEGTPTAAGDFRFTASVLDSINQTAAAELTVTIREASAGPTIGADPLPEGRVGTDYCAGGPVQVSATGGSAPYRWSAVDEPPAGLTFSEAGALCGTPTQAGDFSFVVRVTDADGFFDTQRLTLTVRAAGELAIGPDGLPDAFLGQAYTAALTATGGTPPVTFEVNAADLPPGIAMSAEGAFSGTPTAEGSFPFLVTARDASGVTRPKALSIRVAPPGGDPLSPGLESGSGCRSGDPGASAAWLAVLLLGILRRRRAL